MKNLLLIDDEIDLLESLKELLSSEYNAFATQIAFSVDEAIELIKKINFDLIITDIRMPEKSGLELLIFLRTIEYKGEIMVMTAYGDSETKSHIKTLGSAKIIAKPFNYEWFKNMLIDFFRKKGFSGTIDSIDLTTLLQVIHLEKKTTAIEIEINKETGFLYFKDGELINAEFKGFSGEEAAFKLIGSNNGHFNLVRNKRSNRKSINIPFMSFLIGVMKDVDEIVDKREIVDSKKKIIIKETILLNFKEITGYKWIVFFNIEDDVLLTDIKNDSYLTKYMSMFDNILDNVECVLHDNGKSNIEFLLIEMKKEIFVFSELNKKDIRVIVNLDINGDLVKTKQIIKRIINDIEDYIA